MACVSAFQGINRQRVDHGNPSVSQSPLALFSGSVSPAAYQVPVCWFMLLDIWEYPSCY